jgi:hypothetical protein
MMSREINDLKQQIMWLQNRNAFLTNRQEALRDHFAGLAMQSLINVYVNTGNETPDDEYLAGWAYKKADAMLAEREKGQ